MKIRIGLIVLFMIAMLSLSGTNWSNRNNDNTDALKEKLYNCETQYTRLAYSCYHAVEMLKKCVSQLPEEEEDANP